MIDTIDFVTTDEAARAWKYIIPQENIRQVDEHSFLGRIKNMKIKENIGGVEIIGSPAKYLQDENISTFTRELFIQSLQKLENDTGIDLHNGFLRRADIGKNIITEHLASEYMNLFRPIPRYNLIPTLNMDGLKQILYKTNTGAFEFAVYDKIKEMTEKHKEERIPDFYKDCNVLRVEYRITKRQGIKSKLGNGADVTPWELAEENKYKEFKKQFIDFYNSIPKNGRRVCVDGGEEITPKDLIDILAESYRQSRPQDYRALIQQLRERGKLSDKSLERIREHEKKCRKNFTISDTNDLIIELDQIMQL